MPGTRAIRAPFPRAVRSRTPQSRPGRPREGNARRRAGPGSFLVDLVDDLNEGRAKLAELKKDELPSELKDKTPEQQKAYLAQQEKKRKEVQAQVDVVKKRQAYIADETKKAAGEGKGSAFDVEVARTLKEQAKRKNIAFGTTP